MVRYLYNRDDNDYIVKYIKALYIADNKSI